MKSTVTINVQGKQDPFVALPALGGTDTGISQGGGAKNIFRALMRIFDAVTKGGGVANRKDRRPTIRASTAEATGTVTFATAVAGNTITINGQALTATQQNATGTVTCVSATAGMTVTVNGLVLTGSNTPTGNQFDTSGTDTAAAASIVTVINANTSALISGLIGAKNAAGVVTFFAKSPGTAGNAYTLASSDGTALAVSGATLANGAAAANNQFDFAQSDILNATQLCGQLNGGTITTAIVADHVSANNIAAVVTCASVAVADYITLNGEVLTAGSAATDASAGGARTPTAPINAWCQADTDTNDAISLCNCINNHPRLRELYIASNSSGVVTIREKYPTQGGNSILTSSNGTRLAVTGTTGGVMQPTAVVLLEAKVSGSAGNAITLASSGSTLAVSGSRLTGGAGTTYTF